MLAYCAYPYSLLSRLGGSDLPANSTSLHPVYTSLQLVWTSLHPRVYYTLAPSDLYFSPADLLGSLPPPPPPPPRSEMLVSMVAEEQSFGELFVALQAGMFDCVPVTSEMKEATLHNSYVGKSIEQLMIISSTQSVLAVCSLFGVYIKFNGY